MSMLCKRRCVVCTSSYWIWISQVDGLLKSLEIGFCLCFIWGQHVGSLITGYAAYNMLKKKPMIPPACLRFWHYRIRPFDDHVENCRVPHYPLRPPLYNLPPPKFPPIQKNFSNDCRLSGLLTGSSLFDGV